MADRITQLKSMLESEPDDSFCLYGLAMEYAKAGRTPDAIEYFDRTLAVDPQYCYAYFHKAKCQEEAGDLDAALVTLRAGLSQARSAGDAKAVSELAAFLDQLE